MFTLVIGGAASGKSEYAEGHALSLSGRRVYLATMHPADGECLARIEKHRLRRVGKEFETVEQYIDLANAPIPAGANILLECVGNLLANEVYEPNGGGSDAVLHGINTLLSWCRHLTVVTNEVCSGADYDESTLFYLRELARVNRALAAQADSVVEVVCGLPHFWKGAP